MKSLFASFCVAVLVFVVNGASAQASCFCSALPANRLEVALMHTSPWGTSGLRSWVISPTAVGNPTRMQQEMEQGMAACTELQTQLAALHVSNLPAASVIE